MLQFPLLVSYGLGSESLVIGLPILAPGYPCVLKGT
jgi:hypothetical protein